MLEAKAKDTKKIRGQGQPFRGQTLSRTDPLEDKYRNARSQGHKRKCFQNKKKSSKFFSGDLQKKPSRKKCFSRSIKF